MADTAEATCAAGREGEPVEVSYLLSPRAVRERCARVLELALEGRLASFRVDLARLDAAVAYVLDVISAAYPTLDVPLHARWRHFDVGGVARVAALDALLARQPPEERARAKVDLAVTSVLVDAGAGPAWAYREPGTGRVFTRSEGLAVASYHLFVAGALSSDPGAPLRADADALASLTAGQLAEAFQVRADNPLVGLDGRLALLHGLARALREDPARFGRETPRPGGLVDHLAGEGEVSAAALLGHVLRGLGSIWPGRVTWPPDGAPAARAVSLGDVWPLAALGDDPFAALVPFHKLSQWLTYSLVEPLAEAQIRATGLSELTGLPEYRNGGLLLDMGVIVPRDPGTLARPHAPASEVIVAWRALTVALLDLLAARLRGRLGKSDVELPLARVLEGGTWSAGRKIAAELRPGGAPPLALDSDGTVF